MAKPETDPYVALITELGEPYAKAKAEARQVLQDANRFRLSAITIDESVQCGHDPETVTLETVIPFTQGFMAGMVWGLLLRDEPELFRRIMLSGEHAAEEVPDAGLGQVPDSRPH